MGEAAQFNMIVSGIPLRETPDTIFNVSATNFNGIFGDEQCKNMK